MSRVFELYKVLHSRYGDAEKYWPQWCKKYKTKRERELTAIGAILTQRTSWHNANIALKNLKSANLLSVERIAKLKKLDELIKLLRPAGFYTTKPKRVHDFCSFILVSFGKIDNLREMKVGGVREKLLSVSGIGPETADVIITYALDKPSFIVDEYKRRFVRKYKLTKKQSYEEVKEYFEDRLPKSTIIYQNFHALVIIDAVGVEKGMMEVV